MEQNSREKRKQIICELVEDPIYVPMKEKELAMLLQVSREDREDFSKILQELLAEGKLTLTLKGKYIKFNGKLLTGTFISNAKGFGFVEVEGQEEDYYIPEDMVNGAYHKDIVQIALLPEKSGKRKEAKVVKVIARGLTSVVGTYEQSREHYGFVIPDLTKLPGDIFIPVERSKGAVSGHKVIAEITDYGGAGRKAEGKIVEILGHINDPGVDILSIVKAHDIPTEFPEKVLNQAQRVAKEVSDADRAGRRDLRDVTMVTIDGEDAKDLDDAVSVSFDGDKYHLGVHIADVSNYVQEGSALDREAIKRGTSVYLTDRVIPMLPHTLSNGICSLNQGEDRLALSCLMTIDLQGEITDYEICESVICVNKRMSYTVVKELLEREEQKNIGTSTQLQEPDTAHANSAEKQEPNTAQANSTEKQEPNAAHANSTEKQEPDTAICQDSSKYLEYDELVPMFVQMRDLAALLRKKRSKRGSIDFDFPECKIYLDQDGHPTDIRPYERNVATDLIEDFMLAANETVAQHFYWQEIPFVYRVHDVPDADRMKQLATFIQNYGYYMKSMSKKGSKVGSDEVHPKEIQKLLAKVAGTNEEAMISRLTLRSMKQAKYSTECTGHFGLACKYYCHFTSPIRRYPDLQIHRIIKEQLRGRLKEDRLAHYLEILPAIAKSSSDMERRADEAERETDKLKKAEYMEQYIGECFDGVVSGITAWGVYVELPNTVEGLIHVSKLPGDYYYYNEKNYEMVGEATGRTFRPGMPVRVSVDGVDRFMKTIDFSLVQEK